MDFRDLVRTLFSLYKTRIWMQKLDVNGNLIHSSFSSNDPNAAALTPQRIQETRRDSRKNRGAPSDYFDPQYDEEYFGDYFAPQLPRSVPRHSASPGLDYYHSGRLDAHGFGNESGQLRHHERVKGNRTSKNQSGSHPKSLTGNQLHHSYSYPQPMDIPHYQPYYEDLSNHDDFHDSYHPPLVYARHDVDESPHFLDYHHNNSAGVGPSSPRKNSPQTMSPAPSKDWSMTAHHVPLHYSHPEGENLNYQTPYESSRYYPYPLYQA